jgi:hypothetical protein
MQGFRPLLLGATVCCLALAACPMYALAEPVAPEAEQGAKPAGVSRDGQHDFDF